MLRLRAVLCVFAALLACVVSRGSAGAQVIVGRVVDAATGAAVPQARVTAVGENRREAGASLTAADGSYSIAVRGGSYRVQAARTGYRPARSDAVTVGQADTVRVDVRVAVLPRQLSGLTASTLPRRLPMSGGFTPRYPTDSLIAAERIRVEGDRGKVIVRGVMVTPNPCWRLAGAADRVGALVTLNIQARFVDERCPPDAAGASTYKVSLGRIPPGIYTVRVLHTYIAGTLPPAVALDSAGVTVR